MIQGMIGLLIVGGIVTVSCNWWLLRGVDESAFGNPQRIPAMDVALVLGTAPKLGTQPNRFFEARMNTAAELWKAGKARHFVVEHDNPNDIKRCASRSIASIKAF